MNGKSRFSLHIGLIVATVIILATVAAADPDTVDAPRDRDLVALFRSHRDAFERLCKIAIEDDGLVGYLSSNSLKAKTLSEGRNNLSEARRKEYMSLLAAIRPDLIVRTDVYQISFSYWGGGTGLAIGRSWMKGIAYLPYGYHKVGVTVRSLDKLPEHDGVYLVPIEGDWYIIYVNLD